MKTMLIDFWSCLSGMFSHIPSIVSVKYSSLPDEDDEETLYAPQAPQATGRDSPPPYPGPMTESQLKKAKKYNITSKK
jgi:hypothetical protein